MQEDLEHIDLIDKYLSGTLNPAEKEKVETLLLNDSDFAKEVAVYKKIYEGIKQREENNLKKRLGSYFKEFNEDQSIINDQKPKGKYRKLIRYSGAIAACLLIGGALLFFNNYEKTRKNAKPSIVDVDTTAVKKTDSIFDFNKEKLAEEEKQDKPKSHKIPDDNLVNQNNSNKTQKKDSILLPNNIEDAQLAFGGYKTLPSNAVRSYVYLKFLSYTFDDGILKLYGDPLLGRLDLLSLRLIKNKEEDYVFRFKNKYYPIEETLRRKQLLEAKEETDNNGFSTLFKKIPKINPTQEEVMIEVVGVESTSTNLSNLIVRFKSDEGIDKTYFFNKNEENLELIINANLDQEKAKVYKIAEDSEDYYFLVQGNDIYELDTKAKEPMPLSAVDITTNKLARLFIGRKPIKTVVYKTE